MSDEINLKSVLKRGQAEVTLYDHNIPSPKFKYIKSYVTSIMDHHVDRTKTFYPKKQTLKKKIQLTGSATTLIIQKFLK